MNDRSSNYVAVNAVQHAIAERCRTIITGWSANTFPVLSRHGDVLSRGEVRGNGSRADALSQTRQVILLGIEHGLWRGLPGLLRNAKRCSDDGVMIDGWQAPGLAIVLFSEVLVVVRWWIDSGVRQPSSMGVVE